MAEHRCFFHNFQTLNLGTVFKNFDDGLGHIVNMALGIYPAGNGQPNQLKLRRYQAPVVVVFSKHKRANFHTSYSAVHIQFAHQRLPRVMLYRNVGKKCLCIQIHRMAARRLQHGNSGGYQFVGQVFHTSDAVLQVVVVHYLFQADGNGFQVSPGKPAVGRKSFGDYQQVAAIFGGNGVRWSNGATQPSIWVKQSGVYYVNSFVNAECQSDTSLRVTINALPKSKPVQITSPAATSICTGDSLLLQAPGGYASYRWSNGKTTPNIYAKTAGRYSVQVAGTNGCFSDTLGFFTSGMYFFPAGATDGDSIHIYLNPSQTCPLPAQNPATSMQGANIARLHSGVTLNGTDWQNVVSTTTPAIEPLTRFINLQGSWFRKSILPKNYYSLGNQSATQLCLVTNGGNPVGGWFEKEGKRVSGGPCADFFIPLPIPRNAFSNPFAVTVTVLPTPTVSISQTGGQLLANPAGGLLFQWLLNGQPVSGATGSTFTPNQNGSYQVVATNNQNCRDTSNAIIITGSQSLVKGNTGIQLYPNPVAKNLVVETSLSGMESTDLEWFDLQGKRLFGETLHFENGKAEMDLSTRNLPKAMYQIRIGTPGGSEWKRVMKE